MAERVTAEQQLARILRLIPLAAREDGATLSDLAQATGSAEKTVLRDLEEVWTRAYYQRAGSIDDIQIALEEDRVSVWTTGEFRRPVRLGPEESIATALALRVIAAGSDDEAPGLIRIAERLEKGVLDERAVEIGKQLTLDPAALAAGGPHETLAAATREQMPCRIRYLKPGAETPEERIIDPYVLVNDGGRWYVIGHCHASEAIRVFRFDRILEAEATTGSFDFPMNFQASDYLAMGRVFRSDEFENATVRYSPRIARWIAEDGPVTSLDDGSAIVSYAVADRQWLMRHLLEFGADAVLLEPPSIRDELVHLLRKQVRERSAD